MTNIRLEAEGMTLNGYSTESQSFASGGELIKTKRTGAATTNFTGATGNYQIRVGYYDENDGKGQLSVRIDGVLVDTFTLDQDLGSPVANGSANFVERVISPDFAVNAGAQIQIEGIKEGGELVRVDYIEFIPTADSPPVNSPPVATDDTYSAAENTVLNIAAATGLLNNDSDANGDSLSVNAFDAASTQGGTVSVSADGSFTYTPRAGFSGNDSFTYTVSDGNGGSDTATVNLTVNSSSTPLRLEAEAMTLSGYSIESQSFASGGNLIKTTGTGAATTNFTGATGNYQIKLGYYDENDGKGQLSVRIDGVLVDTFTLDQDLGSPVANGSANFVERVISPGFAVNAGAQIQIEGIREGSELVRVDYIEFVPSGPDLTAPTATPTAENAVLSSASADSYTFTVTYSDDFAIDVSTLDNLDVRVTGPNGFNELATLVSTDASNNGTPRTATYAIAPPAGGWTSTDSGQYTVTVEANQVSDVSGNFVAGGVSDTFNLSIESSSNTLDYTSSSKAVIARLDKGFTFISAYDGPVKIMPLGDSITLGVDGVTPLAKQDGYREDLWNEFQDLGLEVDFMGSLSNGPSSFPDKHHEGHGGKGVSFIRQGIDGYISTYQPDVILLMIGTNDLSGNGKAVANNLDRLIDDIVDNPLFTGDLLVASPPPIHPNSRYANRIPNLEEYVNLIPEIVASKAAEGKNVSYVDVNGALTVDDLAGNVIDNGLHPNQQGYVKIKDKWLEKYLEVAGERQTFSNIDHVIGSTFNDVLVGNSNRNTIEGGAGRDELTGNGGADQFVYRNAADQADTITDFNVTQGDTFRISASGFGGGLTAGVDLRTTSSSTGVLVSDSNPNSIGQSANFLYNTSTGLLSFDQDGVGKQAAVAIATLQGAPTLGIGQFEIIA